MGKLDEFEKLMDEMRRRDRCFGAEAPKFFDERWFVESDIALVGLAPSIHRLTPKLILARNVKPYVDALLQGMGGARENVYMTNLIKCTIPHVRTGCPKMCKVEEVRTSAGDSRQVQDKGNRNFNRRNRTGVAPGKG